MEDEVSDGASSGAEKVVPKTVKKYETSGSARINKLRQLLSRIKSGRNKEGNSNKPFEKPAPRKVESTSESLTFPNMESLDRDVEVERKVYEAIDYLGLHNLDFGSPLTVEMFQDPDLFKALPKDITNKTDVLASYIQNTGKFNALIYTERSKRALGDNSGLLGEKVHLPEFDHGDGKTWQAEDGYKLNLEYLESAEVDPSKVLFFRRTQPMVESPKPERYWTSDYFEVVKGLNVEISGDRRASSMILVADLKTLNENGGLIQDVNDDNGISVRQIGDHPFDQSQAIARISQEKVGV